MFWDYIAGRDSLCLKFRSSPPPTIIYQPRNTPISHEQKQHILMPMPSNEHHKWLKKRDWPAVRDVILHPNRDIDLLRRKYKKRDEHGRLPHHWLAEKAQTHTHTLADVGVVSIYYNYEALATRDNKGDTPIDIARRSGACAEIIGLLSLTPEEAHSLDFKGMARLYAPVAYWNNEMVTSGSMSMMTSWWVKCSNT